MINPNPTSLRAALSNLQTAVSLAGHGVSLDIEKGLWYIHQQWWPCDIHPGRMTARWWGERALGNGGAIIVFAATLSELLEQAIEAEKEIWRDAV